MVCYYGQRRIAGRPCLRHFPRTYKVGRHDCTRRAALDKGPGIISAKPRLAVLPLHLKLGALMLTAAGRYLLPDVEYLAPNEEGPS